MTEDEAFQAIMEALDESTSCEYAPGVLDFCCQWNRRAPCGECAALERRVRQVIRSLAQRTEPEKEPT